MKQHTDKGGMVKDIIKGAVCLGAGIVLIIIGAAWTEILPLAIVLWVAGAGLTFSGLGLIIHVKRNNTYTSGGRSSSSSSSSSSAPRSHRHPEDPSASEHRVWYDDVYKAVRYLSYGSVYVTRADVYERYTNEFDIQLTLTVKGAPDNMTESEARHVVDMAVRAVERLGAGASISARFE